MRLVILNPDKRVFEGDVREVTLPGIAGPFQVLKDHAPLISTLQKGPIRYEDEQQEHVLAIEAGWVKVLRNTIMVLVTSTT